MSVVVWLKAGAVLVPVTVTVDAPIGAVLAAVKVMVVPTTLAVTPVGNPLVTLSVTVPLKPPLGVTTIESVAVPPCATDTLAGLADKEKSGVTVPGIVKAIVVVWVMAVAP